MINLEPEYIEFIKRTVASHLKHYKLYVFGSRVTGRAKQYSDIDLALDSEELTGEVKSKLEFIFENSTMPYEVDIVDLRKISEKFKNIISKDLVLLD